MERGPPRTVRRAGVATGYGEHVRRAATALVVAAVFLVTAAAVLDSLLARSESGGGEPVRTVREEPARASKDDRAPTRSRSWLARGSAEDDGRVAAPADLRKARVSGVLVFADPACRIHALRLPSLEPVAPPGARRCRAGESASARPCRERVLEVATSAGAPVYEVRGCAATSARVTARRTVLRAGDLRSAFRHHARIAEDSESTLLRSTRVTDVVWLTATRFAVVINVGSRPAPAEELIVVYEGDEPVAADVSYFSGFFDLEASPRGTYIATRNDSRGSQLLLYDRRARAVPLPAWFPHVRDVAWSPDERWTAVATRASVYLFRTGARDRGLIRLPLVASDLVWLRR